jgi:hypothetical protein
VHRLVNSTVPMVIEVPWLLSPGCAASAICPFHERNCKSLSSLAIYLQLEIEYELVLAVRSSRRGTVRRRGRRSLSLTVKLTVNVEELALRDRSQDSNSNLNGKE